MDVGVEIGENHRYKICEALLIYQSGGLRTFITRHQVAAQIGAPPVLGPAQPLTHAFIESLVTSLGGSADAEILPPNVLAKGNRVIAWWTPSQGRQMFFSSSEGKAAGLNGRIFPHPPLVWLVRDGSLSIRALLEDKRPEASTKMAVAPYWNISAQGLVCLGNARTPESTSVSALTGWEKGFYESTFTHSNVGRSTRHEGGFEGLWGSLAGKPGPFPSGALIPLAETLAQFLRGESRES